MAWINCIEMNMDISRNVYEGRPNHSLIALVQKVAVYTVIPLALIALFEGVVKNMILFNLANATIVLLNRIHDTFVIPERVVNQ